MSSLAVAHAAPSVPGSAVYVIAPTARPRPGPWRLLAPLAVTPLLVIASIVSLSPAVALTAAFALVVLGACGVAAAALTVAADEEQG